MFSRKLTSHNLINTLQGELEKILSEEHNLSRVKQLTILEEELVRPCANKLFVRSDLQKKEDIDAIKKLQDIKETIIHEKTIAEDKILSKHIDNVSKTNDAKYISSTLVSLCEEYWDTEYIERKIFLRKQAEKCIKNLSDNQKYERKNDFAYEDIIAPITPQP
jgi:hypothetical protein